MRQLPFVLLIILLSSCSPVEVSLNGNEYSNLKYTFNDGQSDLVYSNSKANKIQLSFSTQDTLTEDLSLGLVFISEKFTTDQIFTNFNETLVVPKNSKTFSWELRFTETLPSNERIKFTLKVKDFNNKIHFSPDSFDFDFTLNFTPPQIISPTQNSYINTENQRQFEVKGTCLSDHLVEILVKGHSTALDKQVCTENNFSMVLDLSTLADGNVTLQVRQTDDSNNISPASEITYIKDTLIKPIPINSDPHPLKNMTSYVGSFQVSGVVDFSSFNEVETNYLVELYEDISCVTKLGSSTISNNAFTIPVDLQGRVGSKTFAARLVKNTGSRFNCTPVDFNYYYSKKEILIGGNFDSFNGNSNKNILKLRSDGSMVPTTIFNSGNGFEDILQTSDDFVNAIFPFSTKHVVVGNFNRYNGTTKYHAAIITNSGEAYEGINLPFFNANVRTAAIDNSNQIILGGEFDFSAANTNASSLQRTAILKLKSLGELDDQFTNNINGSGLFTATPFVTSVITDSENNIYLAGSNSGRITKLNASGIENADFIGNKGSGFDGDVTVLKLISDGNLLVGGHFSSYNGITCPKLAKISKDGVLNTAFCAAINSAINNAVLSLEELSNNILLVGGNFSQGIKSINLDGTPNGNFDFGIGFDKSVQAIKEFEDGKVIIGGDFTTYKGNSTPGLLKIKQNGEMDLKFLGNDKFTGGSVIKTISY